MWSEYGFDRVFRSHAAKGVAGTDQEEGWHCVHQPAEHKINDETRVSQAFAGIGHEARLDRLITSPTLGAFYRRMRARLGPHAAIVATAHKLARIVYHLLTHRTPFHDLSPTEYEQRTRDRDIAVLRNKAAKLGLTLVESSTSSTNI